LLPFEAVFGVEVSIPGAALPPASVARPISSSLGSTGVFCFTQEQAKRVRKAIAAVFRIPLPAQSETRLDRFKVL
jgi:hypothetical protein